MTNSTHNKFVQIEVSKYPAIKREKRKLVQSHYFGAINLRKIGRTLTAEEKSVLGLYQNQHITTAMIDLVEPGMESLFDIDEALRLITHNARQKYQIYKAWQELITQPNVIAIEFSHPNDKLTCKHCSLLNDKPLKKKFKLLQHLENYCSCIWFRGELNPHLAKK